MRNHGRTYGRDFRRILVWVSIRIGDLNAYQHSCVNNPNQLARMFYLLAVAVITNGNTRFRLCPPTVYYLAKNPLPLMTLSVEHQPVWMPTWLVFGRGYYIYWLNVCYGLFGSYSADLHNRFATITLASGPSVKTHLATHGFVRPCGDCRWRRQR